MRFEKEMVYLTQEDLPGINEALKKGYDVRLQRSPNGVKMQRLSVETIGRRSGGCTAPVGGGLRGRGGGRIR